MTVGGDWLDASGRLTDTCTRSAGLNERQSSGIFRGTFNVEANEISDVKIEIRSNWKL